MTWFVSFLRNTRNKHSTIKANDSLLYILWAKWQNVNIKILFPGEIKLLSIVCYYPNAVQAIVE